MRVALDTAYELKPPQYAQINRTHPLARGLCAFWIIDGQALTARDAVLGLPATYGAAATNLTSVGSPYGTGVAIGTGAGSFYTAPPVSAYQPASLPVSLMAIASWGGSTTSGVTTGSGSNYGGVYLYAFNAQLTLLIGNGSGGLTFLRSSSGYSGFHVFSGTAINYNAMSLYVDGSPVAGGYSGGAVTMNPIGNATIGALLASTNGGASIVAAAIWNRVLSDAEHRQLGQQPFCMFNRRPIPVAA